MRTSYTAGWTEEDQKIWKQRKIPANRIHLRYQHHLKEFEIMRNLSRIDLPPGEGKMVAMAIGFQHEL